MGLLDEKVIEDGQYFRITQTLHPRRFLNRFMGPSVLFYLEFNENEGGKPGWKPLCQKEVYMPRTSSPVEREQFYRDMKDAVQEMKDRRGKEETALGRRKEQSRQKLEQKEGSTRMLYNLMTDATNQAIQEIAGVEKP